MVKPPNSLQNDALKNLNGVIIFSLDAEYCYTAFSDSHRAVMHAIWGVEIEIGQCMLEYLQREDDRNKAKHNFDKVLQGETLILEEEYGDAAGHLRTWWENRYSPIYDAEKKIVGLTVFVLDITMRKREDERIRYLAFVMNKISSAVISTDANLRISHWNKGAEALYGWQEAEVLGLFVDEVCGTEFSPGQQESAQQHLMAEKSWRAELKQRHRNGAEIWVDASVTLLEDEQGNFIGGVTINSDITERKLAEEELRRTKESIEQINHTLRRAFEREQVASRTDALTGVFNRRYFFELLEYEFTASQRYQRPLSLVMFDVDYLKKVNDAYGHQAGDEMLKKAAQVVGSELRDSDVLSRYGGDEFVILLSNSDEEEAANVLNRIHTKIQTAQVVWDGHQLGITISAGIASRHAEVANADHLVTLADRALYIAKNSGRNQVSISPGNEMK